MSMTLGATDPENFKPEAFNPRAEAPNPTLIDDIWPFAWKREGGFNNFIIFLAPTIIITAKHSASSYSCSNAQGQIKATNFVYEQLGIGLGCLGSSDSGLRVYGSGSLP